MSKSRSQEKERPRSGRPHRRPAMPCNFAAEHSERPNGNLDFFLPNTAESGENNKKQNTWNERDAQVRSSSICEVPFLSIRMATCFFLEIPIAFAMSSIVTLLNPSDKNNSSDFNIIFSLITRREFTTGNSKNN